MFRFCFTLDTEPDDLWANRPAIRFEHFAHLADFHRELADRGAKPTYLTTSEVAEDSLAARALDQILSTGQAEIGAHFHTWTRRWPFPVPDLGNPPIHATAHGLGQVLEERMLTYTCKSLERAFGVRPISYRGGRWSLNGDSIQSLVRCGIRVDSTVTPGISWEDGRHLLLDGPDFRRFPRHPFFLRGSTLEPRADGGEVLELPVGASFQSGPCADGGDGLLPRAIRKALRVVGRPVGWVWLRPTFMSRSELRACLDSLRNDSVPVWVAMIHSSEIAPCKHLPDQKAVQRFRRRCLDLVEDARALGATGATLHEVYGLYERGS
jgi:hypothetical protein